MGIEKLPLIGGLFDNSDDKAKEQLDNQMKLWDSLSTPDLEWENYSPEMMQYMGDVNPEAYQYELMQQNPELYADRLQQLDVLKQRSLDGLTPMDELAYESAAMEADRDARGKREALLSQAKQRGTAGGGLDFLARQQADQDATQRAQMAGMQQAADSARQRALSELSYGDALTNFDNSQYSRGAANKDIINRFNEMNTRGRNDAAYNNQAARQANSNANTGARNEAQLINQQGRTGIAQQNFGNQITKNSGKAGVYGQMYNDYAAQAAANAKARSAGGQAIGAAIGGPAGAAIGGGVGDLF